MTTYEIDTQHTKAQFSVRHLMISNVKGTFQKTTGTVAFDANNLAVSKIDVSIDARTVDTHEPQRDEHLRSADFFDVEKFPFLTFQSTAIEAAGEGFTVKGGLTIHGVTKEITLKVDEVTPEVKDPWGNIKVGATASTAINRKDFGLVWNAPLEFGGFVVGDEVKITIEAELTKKS